MKNVIVSHKWFKKVSVNTQSVDKRLDASIREILKTVPGAENADYNYRSKNGKLIIKYNKKKLKDYDISEKFGYILLFCFITSLLTFTFTHVFYLSFLIILSGIFILLIPFNTIVNSVKKTFFIKIIFPFMVASCLFTTALSWSRMNYLYETNASIKKEQITKVHENIPYWIYDFKVKKVENNK